MTCCLALWITSLMADSESARNAAFPEAADHPVLFEGSPLRGYCSRLGHLAGSLGHGNT